MSKTDHCRVWMADGSVFWTGQGDYERLHQWLADPKHGPESTFELTDVYHGKAVVIKHWVMGVSEWTLEGYKRYLEHNNQLEATENQFKKRDWEE